MTVTKRKRPDREAVKRLEAVYAKLPKLACQGRCQECCGPIGMSPVEHQRMAERGRPIPGVIAKGQPDYVFSPHLRCPQLAGNGRCTVYAIRPMLCRIWGMVESMRCPFGCVPEGGFLPEDQCQLLMREAMEAGGVPMPPEEFVRERLKDPQIRAVRDAIHARGRRNDHRRMGFNDEEDSGGP